MQQANSPGFERWAKIFNLKEMAKTVMYLQENNLTDLGELEKYSCFSDCMDGSFFKPRESKYRFAKHLAFKIPHGKRFVRCDSLGAD